MSKKINQDIKEAVINDYLNGISAENCARTYSIGATSVRRYLKQENISTKLFDLRKYHYNEDYFNVIDTEEKAYWLGFIAADGSITKNSTILEISLKSTDKSHLVKFMNAINGSETMIKDREIIVKGKKHYAARIMVCSPKICKDLAKWEIIPNKGSIIGFPKFLTKNLLPSYIRGYFDGDGSVGTAGKAPSGAQKYNVSIIATEHFINDLMDYLNEFNISKVTPEIRHNMAIWKKGGIPQIKIFLEHIYIDAQVYLDRKYQCYFKICRPESNITEDSGGLGWN